jgi:hypothetical protein
MGGRQSDDELRSPYVRVRIREASDDSLVHFVHEIETFAAMVPAESLAAFAAFAARVPGRLEFGLQSSIGRAGRPADAGVNLPLLFILLACLAACVMIVVRGSRAEPPKWWTRRTLAFSDEAAATAPPSPARIGGWLLLPAFGLLVSPFRIAYEARSLPSLLDQSVWNATVEAAGPERAAMQFLLLFELCGNMLLIALYVWAILELFRRRRIFPLAYIVAMGSWVVLVMLDLVLVPTTGPLATQDLGGAHNLGGSLAAFAIWSAYMLESKRVRRTFVR